MICYYAIGVMSGTSLDGLDIALCKFTKSSAWDFEIIAGKTFKYNDYWYLQLSTAHNKSGIDLIKLHNEYGIYIGEKINSFLKKQNYPIDFIASHGHTVFHHPENNTCFQIGNGSYINATTNLPCISDFRTADIANGGQGAPLVPIGDKLLFSQYQFCLNLGGFANISMDIDNKRIAYDICPVNIALNHYAQMTTGTSFDKNGETGRRGAIKEDLLLSLNQISFYQKQAPKSLSREWLENNFLSLIKSYNYSNIDILRTLYEHISFQICKSVNILPTGKLIITGGGAFNQYLIELLRSKSKHNIEIPNKNLIDFKEALIFAFLGVLKQENTANCLSSVTGAKNDCIGGVEYNAFI